MNIEWNKVGMLLSIIKMCAEHGDKYVKLSGWAQKELNEIIVEAESEKTEDRRA